MSDSLLRDPRPKRSSPPSDDRDPFAFDVIPGTAVRDILAASQADLVPLVAEAYLAHAQGRAHNPPSYFLRFDDRPQDRIIALPADLGDMEGVAGIKWISSWPENVAAGMPRASALLALNRRDTGYPFCVLEASLISAARTAASAILALEHLRADRLADGLHVGFVGCGVIARQILDMMLARGIRPGRVQAYDLRADDARRLLRHAGAAADRAAASSIETVIRTSDVVVFATTAASPHVAAPEWFAHAPVVLHVSLRDLAVDVILAADNVVDDVRHVLQADTSVHLAEQHTGRTDFIAGTIAELVRGAVPLDGARPVIFSPFGMGILDLAVGMHVYRQAQRTGRAIAIPGFFADRTRW